MKLLITKEDNGKDGAKRQYKINCRTRYGAPPLTHGSPTPIPPSEPAFIKALESADDLGDLVDLAKGVVFKSDDLRVVEASLTRLQAALATLWQYWHDAEHFPAVIDVPYERPVRAQEI